MLGSPCWVHLAHHVFSASLAVLLLTVQGHSHMHMDSVVKMKSLPFDATQLDIIQFFEAYRLKPNGVQLVVRSDNKPTGEVCACWACEGCRMLPVAEAITW